jgi:para-aminobenzoate synthetase/4-amino-4-deoxychorismate lyase
MTMSWYSLPAEVYALVEQTPATVLLETSKPGSASFSSLFIEPSQILVANHPGDLPELFARIEEAVAAGHFAAGFFTYECGAAFEPKAAGLRSRRAESEPRQPLAWLGIYERCYRFSHDSGAFVDGVPPLLGDVRKADHGGQSGQSGGDVEIVPGMTEQQYGAGIEQIHEWIRAGDVYQLNYTFPLRVRVAESPAALYLRLRHRQPVEFGAFVHCESGRHILSFSPELFFRVDQRGVGRRITARPMKGTARRGRTTAEDRDVADWLRNDVKNRSENVMIVDLIRNDLGRLCDYGSVRVENLFEVERYPTLWQMTSTVTGQLRPEMGFEQIFRALFPCGSITGAPKVHAMQLLAEIEQEPRGVYTGAIGYFSRERTVFNVAIRTVDVVGKRATMGVGGGIVIDSDANEEYRECQLKAEFLTRTEGPFSLIESLLWRGEYLFMKLHLERLEDSSEYFGFVCDPAAVKAALLTAGEALPDQRSRKVRMLLDRDGGLHIEHEVIAENEGAHPGRVRIAAERIDSGDPFFFHKTTRRSLYESAWREAKAAGFEDVLFCNERGEVTEGAVNNVFIERNGRWFTPPVACGLLAGIYRRHLLETRPEIEERILSLEDLKRADAVYVTNAVRGLRRVVIDWEGC